MTGSFLLCFLCRSVLLKHCYSLCSQSLGALVSHRHGSEKKHTVTMKPCQNTVNKACGRHGLPGSPTLEGCMPISQGLPPLIHPRKVGVESKDCAPEWLRFEIWESHVKHQYLVQAWTRPLSKPIKSAVLHIETETDFQQGAAVCIPASDMICLTH